MRAAIYVRISSDPKGAGLGVARQEADCRDYCTRRGWTVTTVYIDNDVSATKGTRPEYTRMLGAVRAGETDAIVAWAYDRLCRRILDLEAVLDLAETHQLTLGCVSGDLDIGSPMGRTLARVLTAIAAGEVEAMKARLRRKQLELADAGKVGNGGRRPYGYTPSRMEVVPGEADIVREIARRILSGESLHGIATDLNVRGVPTVLGGPWQATIVRAVVTKPHVASVRVHMGREHRDGTWPPILDRDTWDAVVGVIRHPSRRQAADHNTRRHLLSGIATCGSCGGRVGVKIKDTGPRYACRECGRVIRVAARVDDVVVGAVIRLLADLPDEAPPAERGPSLADETSALRERRRQVVDDFALLGMDGADLRRALLRIDTRLAEIDAARSVERTPHVLAGLRGITRAQWDDLPLARRRAIIGRLVTVEILPVGKGKPFSAEGMKVRRVVP